MPSPAERRLIERVLRGAGVAALGVMLVHAWRGPGTAAPLRIVAPAQLRATLARLPLSSDTLAVITDSALSRATSAWLAARRDALAPTVWAARAIAPTAIALEPALDPGGGVRALVAAPTGSLVSLADSLGSLDSARVRATGLAFAVAAPMGATVARIGGNAARAHAPAITLPRAVVVLARAGWEAKFVVAALEERGWPVEVRLVVRPDTSVLQGAPTRFDTARVAVIVALDATAASHAGAITAFVRAGGGLVLGPDAAANDAFGDMRAGAPGPRIAPTVLTVSESEPRRALPFAPINSLAAGAQALERRGDQVALAARRWGAGRVVQVGYEDTWRWRMTGPDGAREAHRRWWAGVIASASPERGTEATLGDHLAVSTADAPLARMVLDLGAPDPALLARAAIPADDPRELGWWWGALALASLLAEWASRRLRGAP